MLIKTVPACNDCNEELTIFEALLKRKCLRNHDFFLK